MRHTHAAPLLKARQRPRSVNMPAGAALISGVVPVSGWTGGCAVVQRASDSATADIGFHNGYMDWQAIVNHAGASTCSFRQFMDMSGNGMHPEQTDFAEMPTFRLVRKRRQLYGATCYRASGHWLDLPAGFSVDRRNCTIISVSAAQACNPTSAMWQVGTGTTDRLSFFNRCDGSAAVRTEAATLSSALYNTSQPEVLVLTSSASGTQCRINGRSSNLLAAAGTGAITGGMWGKSATAAYVFYGNMYFFAVYPTVLSEAEIQGVERQLFEVFDVPQGVNKRILCDGDSFVWGQGESGVPFSEFMERLSAGRFEIRNIGVSGRTLSTCATQFNNNVGNSYRADMARNIYVVRAGGNDIFSGADPTTLYGTLTTIVNNARSAGYNWVVVGDLQARGDANPTYQANRVTYNGLMEANSAGADAVVRLSTVFTNSSDSSLYAGDGIHFTDLGHEIAAGLMWAGIEPGLA